MRYIVTILILLVLLSTAVMAQRPGSSEVGGSFSFRSFSDADQQNLSELGIDALLGYYFSQGLGMDIEPGIRFRFFPDSVVASTLIMASLRIKLFDMRPSNVVRREVLITDTSVGSTFFANLGVGLWSEGVSLANSTGANYSGPALMAGIGTLSRFGRISTVRVKLQWIHLFPSGPVYSKPRSLMQVGVGFGIFIRS